MLGGLLAHSLANFQLKFMGITRKVSAPGAVRGVRVAAVRNWVLGAIKMDDIERWAIDETLRLTAGNREEAAKILDIGARTLYRKLDKYKQEG